MKLFIDKNGKPNDNELVFHKDFSFGTVKNDVWFDYQVQLDELGKITLNFNLLTKDCVSLEGYSTVRLENLKKRNIDTSNSTPCSLKIALSEEDPEEWGVTYPFSIEECYFDLEHQRIQFGTSNSHAILFRFGKGQYVYWYQGTIEAILIEFINVEKP